ncbi:hypothetical protein CW733_12585 [Lacinutrix sp. Bg11-31]|nr:hypothetical protein CW733_12585 [Lacinutrix sp. Bg11-31]
MKLYKTLVLLMLSVVVLTSFTQCSSSKKTSNLKNNKQTLKLEDKGSFTLENIYFQSWIAGVRGGGSGIHMYITVKSNKNNVAFDSVYFKGLKSKIEISKMGYIASFKTEANQKDDIIMSNNKNAEFGNETQKKQDFPFELNDNECIISYIENNTTKYLLVENLQEKKRLEYPSAPPKH